MTGAAAEDRALRIQAIAGFSLPGAPAPTLAGARRMEATRAGATIRYDCPAGSLAPYRWLTADFLLEGHELAVFELSLGQGATGHTLRFSFGLLNQCQARLRMPLGAVDQNRWLFEREGALLKPSCWGDRVALESVDTLTLGLIRMGGDPVRFTMTPLRATVDRPPPLAQPSLPAGPLLDELGQSTLHDWVGKSRGADEVTARLQAQYDAAPRHTLPEGLSPWGGSLADRRAATGWFRVERDQKRWWLVDPEGCPFWSAGLDCVRVDAETSREGLDGALPSPAAASRAGAPVTDGRGRPQLNYLAGNLIRAFGPPWRECWARITLAELRRIGFNTVGNWSDWAIARAARVPYVVPLHLDLGSFPTVYRDFPDVFHPAFPRLAARFARQLRPLRDDPSLIGYFLMNEPTWGFAADAPAEGMLYNTDRCATRRALARWLRDQYPGDAALARAWGMPVTHRRVERGTWHEPLTSPARRDLEAFSAVMVGRLFGLLSGACRIVDPHHLNLGVRYYTLPPAWALGAMKAFDVFSMNCYRERLPALEMSEASRVLERPILIGEWHFGALDAGLPGSGIGHVRTQRDRGRAYRVYLEHAAAQSWCVGVHWFTLYDQSALGRFDGENYNIGFLDITNRPYPELCEAARRAHERIYAVARGQTPPFDEAPEYLPLLHL